MLAVVEGRLDPGSDAFRTHIDRCLGCRACEPVCPSGVEYGTLLEHARETSIRAAPAGALTRGLTAVMGRAPLRRLFFLVGRSLRASGLAGLAARTLPSSGPLASARLGVAMLASSRRWRPPAADERGRAGRKAAGRATASRERASADPAADPSDHARVGERVGLLTGCVQAGLYGRINRATARVLRANGFHVVEVRGQDCCGALHAHGGALPDARELAKRNIEAFERAGVERVVVNAAGCGATMKDYGTLLEGDGAWAGRAAALARRVRDATEILAEAGPRQGAPVPCRVAYDHPCHLLHAQRVREAPLRVLDAVPGVDVRIVENADECCGGAGIYGMTHPDLGGRIGGDKVASVLRTDADVVATPNPGCMMQIGAGLRLGGSRMGVAHPVELLDESYRRAGYYDRSER